MTVELKLTSDYQTLAWYPDLHACERCTCRPEAHAPVGGWGPLSAEIFVLGRNPGKQEDRMGSPFVGRAGQELDTWLGVLGVTRERILISNVVKCHTLADREPRAPEVATCMDTWLRRELETFTQVQILIPLGKEATAAVLGPRAASPGKLEPYAKLVEVLGARTIHVLPLAHPAYTLRSRVKQQTMVTQVLPKLREYLIREVPDVYQRATATD